MYHYMKATVASQFRNGEYRVYLTTSHKKETWCQGAESKALKGFSPWISLRISSNIHIMEAATDVTKKNTRT